MKDKRNNKSPAKAAADTEDNGGKHKRKEYEETLRDLQAVLCAIQD